MAQIGTIQVQTQNSGVVDIPVFDTGDSGSSVYEFVRVQTATGVGFIPVVDPADASFPYLRVQSQNQGIVAVHNEASLTSTTAFTDTFSDGTYTDGWSVIDGSWSASNNYLENTSSGNSEKIERDENEFGWYGHWEMDHTHVPQFYGAQCYLFTDGIGSTNNGAYITFQNSNSNYNRELRKIVNGTDSLIGTFGEYDGATYTYRVERDSDGSWRGYVDGTQQFSTGADSDLMSSQPQFGMKADDSGHWWDNFDVETFY